MENTLNYRETAFNMIVSSVNNFDDLMNVQTETGLSLAELEQMYYSVIC